LRIYLSNKKEMNSSYRKNGSVFFLYNEINKKMKQVTRDIDLTAARDILQRAARACLAYAGTDGPQLWPVALEWREERYFVRLPQGAVPPAPGQEVVLLVDEGVYYFDLRAVYVRGAVQPGEGCLEVLPSKTVAWDYGSMREVSYAAG
jgi:hypothetical protein